MSRSPDPTTTTSGQHAHAQAVARYWKAAERICFDTADKQALYDMLSRAEALICRLDAALTSPQREAVA